MKAPPTASSAAPVSGVRSIAISDTSPLQIAIPMLYCSTAATA